ncbi:MAG: hypothetical protein WCV62_05740 [Candidatus Peribacteraceae bacterium]|jgi:hypothetical protein
MSLIKAASLYTKPPKTGVGPNVEYRTHALTAAQNVTGNIVALGILPSGHRLHDLRLEVDPLDTGTAVVLNVGILNTYYNEAEASATNAAAYDSGGQTDTGTAPALVSGHEIISSATIGRSSAAGRGGITATLIPSHAVGVDTTKDRIIAVEIGTQATTAIAGDISIVYETAED